ncbi:MAG: hypothetical protein IJ228_05325 [Succinivibrio sp.]|nr:hypothetical protein [Succinivibrio sp.]
MKKTGLEEDLLKAGFYEETVAVIASLVAFNLCKGDNSFYFANLSDNKRNAPGLHQSMWMSRKGGTYCAMHSLQANKFCKIKIFIYLALIQR